MWAAKNYKSNPGEQLFFKEVFEEPSGGESFTVKAGETLLKPVKEH